MMAQKDIAKLQGFLREVLFVGCIAVCATLGRSVVASSRIPSVLASLIAWILPLVCAGLIGYVLTRFTAIVYHLSNRDAFNFWTLALFGPWSPSIPLLRDYPVLIVENGQVSQKARQSTFYKLGGPGMLVIYSDSAAVLERNGRLTRSLGPTVKFVPRFEQVRELIDLRPQIRQVPAKVMTKDGILLEAEVQATFQLMMENTEPTQYKPAAEVLKKAALWQTNFNRARTFSWADRIAGNLDSTLRGIVSDYTYDELFGKSGGDIAQHLRQIILERMREGLQGAANNFAGRLLDVRLGTFHVVGKDEAGQEFDQKVQLQRVDSWKATREGDVKMEQARAQADTVTLYRQVEVEASRRMVQNIVDCLRPFAEDPAAPNWLVAMRLVEMLDKRHPVSDEYIFVPRETIETLNGLRSTLVASQ